MSTTSGHEPSLTVLEKEAALNRAALIGTVNALQDRISPSVIKQDVQDYVRDKKDGMLRGLEQSIRENPLRAAAIAAGAAYPLWRLVTSLPVPLLLIGAGVALTRRSGQSHGTTGDATFIDDARRQVGEATDSFKKNFDDVAQTVQQRVHDARDTVQRTVDQVSDGLSDLKSQVLQSADSLASGVSEKFSQTSETIRRAASDGVAATAQAGSSGYRSGSEAAARAEEQLKQAGQRSQEKLVDTLQHHPMIVGAVALAIGAVIAAALPVTRQEEDVFGAAGEELKRKVQEMASDGFDAAKNAAQDVYEETLRHAKDQGLSAEGLKEAASEVAKKVTTVIGAATDSPGEQPGTLSRDPEAKFNPAI